MISGSGQFLIKAIELSARGLHVFPCDHPDQPKCIGAHDPVKSPCDGKRGKHPACAWKTYSETNTNQLLTGSWKKRGGLANVGVACGASGVVVLDEDEFGEMDRWCKDTGITLPETYVVTTARGRHFYFGWDYSVQHIGNREQAFAGYKINVRGEGGLVIGEGSQHESGAIYAGNGKSIADLPQEVADKLLAGAPPPPQNPQAFFAQQTNGDPNATMIAFGERHPKLVEYAGRLLGLGLDYYEAEPTFKVRWLLCEQPDGKIPEARFHTATCGYPVEWPEAQAKLASVYSLYPAGSGNGQGPAPAAPARKHLLSVEHLEQDFWDPAPLRQIYDDALGRMLSPWAVLTHCVARGLVKVRPLVVLPPIIGYGSLNWFGAVVSTSGGGKSAAETLAAELIPGISNIRNLGSGEGVAAQYWTPGTKAIPAQRLESMMFYADEVDCVKALAKREGSNLMSVVRTGFSGGTLGFSYTKGNDRHVDAGTYRMTLVLSVQPARSGWLFEDADGGTPQRLMWFPGDDPRISDSRPERGKVIKLPVPDLNANDWQKYPRELRIPDEARRLIRSVRAQTARGETAALDGHALFSREKFAFALALLCGRTEMTSEDWHRAGIAADVSSYTRDWTQQVERTSGVTRATEGGALRGVAQEAADDERQKRRVLRWALRTLDAAPGKQMKYRDLQNKQTSRDHAWLIPALALGASQGLVACTADGEWKLP